MPANAPKSAQPKKNSPGGIREEAAATLKRLEAKDPGLKQFLKEAYGYVVYPSVGKAALVVGGGYGKGLAFERGKPVGYATIAKVTLGVDLGGQTFSEVIAFESREVFERFKRGRFGFSANASAVIVKAGASGTADYEKGAVAFAYSRGGLLLELSLGGQKVKFKPMSGQQGTGEEGKERGGQGQENEEQEGQQQEQGAPGLVGRAASGLRNAVGGLGRASSGLRDVAGRVRDAASGAASGAGRAINRHPVAAALIGGGLAAGTILLAARALGGSDEGQETGDQESEDRESEDRESEDQEDARAEDQTQGEEGEEGEEEEGDEGEEESADEVGGRFSSSSRGRSRH